MNDSAAGLIDFSTVDLFDRAELLQHSETTEFISEAEAYLASFNWLDEITEAYCGNVFEGIIGIFLFKIRPKLVGIDDYTWVVVGDLPPAYITVEECPNPAAALDAYIGAMEEWVDAVLAEKPTQNIIPVSASETKENALMLKSRLEFLDERVLPLCNGDL